jgi:mannitol 2-dehydrogenase
MAEPFKRRVIEDHFINGRPRWEEVGAPMTSNVLRTKR